MRLNYKLQTKLNFGKLAIFGGLGYLAYKYVPTVLSLLKLEITMQNFEVISVEDDNIRLQLNLLLNNNTNTRLNLEQIDLDILLNGETVGKVNQTLSDVLFPKTRKIVAVVVDFNKQLIGDTLWNQIKTQNTAFDITMKGTIDVNDKTLPIITKYTVKDLLSLIGIGAIGAMTKQLHLLQAVNNDYRRIKALKWSAKQIDTYFRNVLAGGSIPFFVDQESILQGSVAKNGDVNPYNKSLQDFLNYNNKFIQNILDTSESDWRFYDYNQPGVFGEMCTAYVIELSKLFK